MDAANQMPALINDDIFYLCTQVPREGLAGSKSDEVGERRPHQPSATHWWDVAYGRGAAVPVVQSATLARFWA